MPVKCVIGMHWGDEGKGGIIDALSEEADLVVRCQGGANAGHTVHVGDKTFKFHLLPCGVLREGVRNLIGHGVVLDIEEVVEEIESLRSNGVNPEGRLFISDRCQVLMPYHKKLDGLSEKLLDRAALGTSKRGIGPCYADKVSYRGIRLADAYDGDFLKKTIQKNLLVTNALLKHVYAEEALDIDELIETTSRLVERLKPFVADGIALVRRALDAGERILVEGAQGTLLDVDYGTYPYVSASNASVHGVSSGSGIPERKIDTVIGVAKAYCTRVGAERGPFPTEDRGPDADIIRKRGKEYGTTTGRPRQCGWLDLVATRYSARVNDVDYLAVSLLDVLDAFDTVKVCEAYELDGKRIQRFPAGCAELMRVKPVYREMPGWKTDITGCRKWEDLPVQAREYIDFIGSFVGAPVNIVRLGPEREQTIRR
ncbi:MAG: adenylosuccinate synthase [Planctomycetota bacterium]|nr:MAG: adenylosuccinate synthase [Planctomycetota bacterium]